MAGKRRFPEFGIQVRVRARRLPCSRGAVVACALTKHFVGGSNPNTIANVLLFFGLAMELLKHKRYHFRTNRDQTETAKRLEDVGVRTTDKKFPE